MPLILTQMPPLHWAVAGAGIAAVTLCLLFLTNKRLGISTGFEDVCSLVVTFPYFRRGSVRSGRQWRLRCFPQSTAHDPRHYDTLEPARRRASAVRATSTSSKGSVRSPMT